MQIVFYSGYYNSLNCIFENNSAYDGAGVFLVYFSNYTNSGNCSFVANQARSLGGAVSLW
jgi:predicted outer membrane repeat protein